MATTAPPPGVAAMQNPTHTTSQRHLRATSQAPSDTPVAIVAGGDPLRHFVAERSAAAARAALDQHGYHTTVIHLGSSLDAELVAAAPSIVPPCTLTADLALGELQELLAVRGVE